MLKFFVVTLLFLNLYAKEKLPANVVKELKVILASNDMLHDKFYKYNSAEVEASKNELKALIEKFKSNKDIQDFFSKAKVPLDKISASKSEAENKTQFSIFNSIIIRILNKYEIDEKYKAYYCPMVRKKWVQDTSKKEKVHNPYDASMPDCGGRL